MASAERLNDSQTDRSIVALQRAIDKVVVGDLTVVAAIEAEYTATASTLYMESTAVIFVPQPRTVFLALREAHKAKAHYDARVLHRIALRAAASRRKAARKIICVRLQPSSLNK